MEQTQEDILESVVAQMTYQQLLHMQKDLANSPSALAHKVNKKISHVQTSFTKQCASCGDELQHRHNPYTLLFGPTDFKKKASFCGLDCLHEFSEKLARIEKKKGTWDND